MFKNDEKHSISRFYLGMYYINMYYNLSFIRQLHATYLIPLLKMFPYNSNWILHLNKCLKNYLISLIPFFFFCYFHYKSPLQ